MSHAILVLAAILLAVTPVTNSARAADPAKKKIVFLPGRQSHGWSGHAFSADLAILAKALNENVPGVDAVVIKGGWPRDLAILDGAAAIVIACDGNGVIGSKANWDALDAIAKKGAGIAFIHYSLDVGKDLGKYELAWIGGYYEQFWSVNPSWKADFKTLPDHPVARGVRPFRISDEWYYHMRFQPEMKGVTPILSAIPPESTRQGKDGAHSGNPEVRARKGMAEHIGWCYERPDGARGFGFTGGHEHWNYANDNFRKVLLNAICWIAKTDIPADGVQSKRPTVEEMEANLEGARPKDWTTERIQKVIDDVNKQ
jgi:type 1 glutamine amidotransferase